MQPFSKAGCHTMVTSAMDYSKLVRDCIRQKPAAQQQLYEHFAAEMLGVCYRYTKSINDAEDVLQEGFIKVFLNIDKYQATGELGAWIRRIMVTTALNYLKKKCPLPICTCFYRNATAPGFRR